MRTTKLAQIFIALLSLILHSCYYDLKTSESDIMNLGQKINAPTPEPGKYFNDLIHPCIRYIPEGFAGHKWWMIASPYYNRNSQIENPILYYGEKSEINNEEIPPLSWIPVKVIEESPNTGVSGIVEIVQKGSSTHVEINKLIITSGAMYKGNIELNIENIRFWINVEKYDSSNKVAERIMRVKFQGWATNLIDNAVVFTRNNTGESQGIKFEQTVYGYNSDPNIFYDGTRLWCFWRENLTFATDEIHAKRAIFGRCTEDGISFSEKKLFAKEERVDEDDTICPIFMNVRGQLKMYSCSYKLSPIRYNIGLSIWEIESNVLSEYIHKKKITIPETKSLDLWHYDIFEYDNIYYCVACSELADKIMLGKSNDGENFIFWDKPLISTANTNRGYFYKPTAQVVNDIFYLWYPVSEQDPSVKTSRIWMSSIPFKDLLHNLEK